MPVNEAQNLDDSRDDQKDSAQSVEELKRKHLSLVEKSNLFSDKDKENARSGDGTVNDPKTLKLMIDHFGEAEKKIAEMEKTFEDQIDTEIAAKRFAKGSKDSYVKWFKGLSFAEKAEYAKKKSSDVYNPKRKEMLGKFMGEIAINGERIPEAIRNEHMKEFLEADLEKREELVNKLGAKHKSLKEAFLKLPKEVQEKNREQFKRSNIAGRERLLSSLGADKKTVRSSDRTAKSNDLAKSTESREGEQLNGKFAEKTAKMVTDNLLAPDSKLKNDIWFKGLPLIKKRQMLNHSDLDTRMKDRLKTKDEFYKSKKIPPEVRAKNDLRFRNADLDKRHEILTEISGTEDQSKESSKKKEGFIRGMLKKLLFSRSHEDITKKMETFAVTDEIAERRKRFRLSHNTREESAAKADKKGLDTTAEESQKLAGATKREDMHEADGGIKVKLDVLESHADARHEWKRTLKPHMGDVNAKLASNITLRTKAGDEVIDERAYQRGELAREVESIQDSMNPLIGEAARAAGMDIDEKEIADVLGKADWKEHGKEVIKRSA